MISLTRRYEFSAAHVLASDALSPEENREIFGKCANPAGHGHNYGLELTVTGEVDDRSGRIIAPQLLDQLYEEVVGDRYAHRLLNELECFRSQVPTAENIARCIYADLAKVVAARSSARLVRVRVVETGHNAFEFGDAS